MSSSSSKRSAKPPPPPSTQSSTTSTSKKKDNKEQEKKHSTAIISEKVLALTNAPSTENNIKEVLSLLKTVEKDLDKEELSLRFWSYSVALRLQLLRVISELAGDYKNEIIGNNLILMEESFNVLLSRGGQLPDKEGRRSAELFLRLNQFCCNIGFKLQKRKLYAEAVVWADRTLEVAELWRNCPSSSGHDNKDNNKNKKVQQQSSQQKPNTRYPSLLKSECLRQLGKVDESLSWLSILLLNEASAADSDSEETKKRTPTTCYDVYEQIPWTEVSTHWIASYKEAVGADSRFNKISLDYLPPQNQSVISKLLKVELNCHFTGRHAVPSGLISVGDGLITRSTCPFDNILGYLAKAIGLFWGNAEQVELAVEVIHQCAAFIEDEDEDFFGKEENLEKTGFMSGILSIWRGICLLRTQQFFVEAEMELLKKEVQAESPEKYKDRDTGEEQRGVSGFSSLNLSDEKEWVDGLVAGVEFLYRVAAEKKLLEYLCTWLECPSLLIISCRLTASLLTAIGHVVYGAKAWHVVYVLAELYDKKGLQVISASELIKILPDLDCRDLLEAEKANEIAIEQNLIKHNRAYVCRINLAKSLALFQLKKYSDGSKQLLKVFAWLESERDNFDSTHHLMGEATYVLSLYKIIQFSHGVDLSSFPPALLKMSPAGVCGKGYKTICGMTRDMDPVNSGWTDLLHNYFILSSIMNIGIETVRLLKDSGRTREMRCYVTDAVHFAQHCGFVSRSLTLLISIIQLDIEARNFIHAQTKIDVVNRVLISGGGIDDDGEIDDDSSGSSVQKIIDNMKLNGLSVQRLQTETDLRWMLKPLEIPSLYYRNRSEKTIGLLKKDLLRQGSFGKELFTFPSFLKHNLTCSCYLCCSPLILPAVFGFFHVQALYLNCMSKAKSGLAVLESSKLAHERSIFRLIYNLSLLSIPLEVIASCRKIVMKSIEIIYTPFCVMPGLHSLLIQMMICPSSDIKMILGAMKKALLVIDTLDPKDYVAKSFPWELGISALHEYFVVSGRVPVTKSQLHQLLTNKNKQNNKNEESTPPPKTLVNDFAGLKISEAAVGVNKKGATLKVTKRAISKKVVEEIVIDDDDRLAINLPILVFDVEDQSPVSNSDAVDDAAAAKNGVEAAGVGKNQNKSRLNNNNVTERRQRRK